jgi:hypothetical protein
VVDVDLQGGLDYAALARRLRKAGERDLMRELTKGVTKATRPVPKAIRAEARAILPKRGGLNVYVARMSIRTKKYTGGRQAGVVITGAKKKGTGKVDVRRINQGKVRHPTYGHGPWRLQQVPRSFWTRPTNKAGPRARLEIQSAMRRVARQIANH